MKFELLRKECEARHALFQYFGYVEDWRVLPFSDATEYVWLIDGEEVRYAMTKEQLLDEEAGEFHQHAIYFQRHLNKWIYRGPEYTMILVDTDFDGNQFLQIFDNSKEITPP
jgi:hypothetical protein